MSEKGKRTSPIREDGRRQLLVFIKSELVNKLKKEAIDKETHMYVLLEEMLSEHFDKPTD
jgi:hypothetical protein